MNRHLLLFLCTVLPAAACAMVEPAGHDPSLAIAGVLDDFHRAASEADYERYFGHFTPDAVFMGTDATERWTVAQFRRYALPRFASGCGWTYVATERTIFVDSSRDTAWFDERLQNAKYGEVRGTGVLRRVGDGWRIAHYNLSFPVPNALAPALVEMVRRSREG